VKLTVGALLLSSALFLMLNALPAESASYTVDKTYELIGDGYITGTAKIACWQYGDEGAKVDIRIDVVKVFHSKGKNELSAYIIDVAKNGPESYIKIGNNVIPKDKYDYDIR